MTNKLIDIDSRVFNIFMRNIYWMKNIYNILS